MEIVSGLGEKPHVTSQQFRQVLEGTIGQKSYIITSGENLEPELAANNLLKIRSGMMSHHGNVSSVKIGTYDEVELTNGSQGMKRIDLVVNRYTRNAETNIEKNEWVVIMGTPVASNPVAPAYTVGNLQKGDLVDDCPVFELHYDGINVTEVKKMLSVLPNVAELNSKMPNQILVEFGSLPNASVKSIDANIPDGATNWWIESAWATNPEGTARYPIPYVDVSNWSNSIQVVIDANKQIKIATKEDWSGYPAFFIVGYKL